MLPATGIPLQSQKRPISRHRKPQLPEVSDKLLPQPTVMATDATTANRELPMASTTRLEIELPRRSAASSELCVERVLLLQLDRPGAEIPLFDE